MKKIVVFMLILAMALSMSTMAFAASAEAFEDIKASDWFYPNVRYAVDHDIIYGTSETTFSPYDSVTRGQFIATLYRYGGHGEEAPVTGKYEDISGDEYFAPAVYWADNWGIIVGATATEFRPNDAITREDVAAMIFNYAAMSGEIGQIEIDTDTPNAFDDDLSISDYALGGVKYLEAIGVIKGDSNNHFNPQSNITRAEYVAIFTRYIAKYNGESDFENVQEAVEEYTKLRRNDGSYVSYSELMALLNEAYESVSHYQYNLYGSSNPYAPFSPYWVNNKTFCCATFVTYVYSYYLGQTHYFSGVMCDGEPANTGIIPEIPPQKSIIYSDYVPGKTLWNSALVASWYEYCNASDKWGDVVNVQGKTTDELLEELKPGAILLFCKKGYNGLSSSYGGGSHIGIYLGVEDGVPYMLHCTSSANGGVVKRNFVTEFERLSKITPLVAYCNL